MRGFSLFRGALRNQMRRLKSRNNFVTQLIRKQMTLLLILITYSYSNYIPKSQPQDAILGFHPRVLLSITVRIQVNVAHWKCSPWGRNKKNVETTAGTLAPPFKKSSSFDFFPCPMCVKGKTIEVAIVEKNVDLGLSCFGFIHKKSTMECQIKYLPEIVCKEWGPRYTFHHWKGEKWSWGKFTNIIVWVPKLFGGTWKFIVQFIERNGAPN